MGIKIDDDLFVQARESVATDNLIVVALLLQVLRELRKEGPEEKTADIKGFTI